MKLPRQFFRGTREAAFTMVEIAICLGVIAFALVAIIGVLPAGMNVQKDNREETIIGQDASVFINAIRNGARGLDDLTNYVMVITNVVQRFTVTPTSTNADTVYRNWYTFSDAFVNGATFTAARLTNGGRIIGLLSSPKYVPDGSGGFYSNFVVANVRAMSGNVTDKFPQKNTNILDFGFGYRLISEVAPVASLDTTSLEARNFQTNLHELRLTFRWPLLPGGVGRRSQTFRTQVSGRVEQLAAGGDYYFLNPRAFEPAP
jgi:type II secretory pathway pseudopilin PulG